MVKFVVEERNGESNKFHDWTSKCNISSSPSESAVAVNEMCGGGKSSSKG